jgi:predicted metal-dependent hydrolase
MKLSIQYHNRTIEFEVVYRNRKTFAIQIKPPDNITVFSPIKLSEDAIKEMVKSKGEWILKKLRHFEKNDPVIFNREFADGEPLMYLGNKCFLQVIPDKNISRPKVKLSDGWLQVTTPVEDRDLLRKTIEKWYRKEAESLICERVDYFKAKFGIRSGLIKPGQVKVKEQKRRWGSCTSKGDLLFNWRMIMAPLPVIDYVVIHELCHLIHRNHSARFWKAVENMLPDYKTRRKWLKDNGVTMDL